MICKGADIAFLIINETEKGLDIDTKEHNDYTEKNAGLDRIGYVSEEWANAGFPNEKSRKRHEKHLVEYGSISFDEYVQGARELLSAEISDDIDEFRNNSGAIYKYRKSTNDFVIGVNGYIITRFQPTDGEEYWKGEKERESI